MSEKQQPPAWIDKQFIQEVLKGDKHDDTIEVIKITISPAVADGDHYATIMFRVIVNYQSRNSGMQSVSLIIKTMPGQTDSEREFFNDSSAFRTEIPMYRDTIPKFEELLTKAGSDSKLGARMLYHSLSPRPVIVFEDLSARGYNVIRHRLMNLEETKAAYEKLAKWHAISYKLGLEGDEVVTKYKNASIDLPGFKESELVGKGVHMFTSVIESTEGFQAYVPRLKQLQDNLVDRAVDVYHAAQLNKSAILVLNHADFHCKNVMMRQLEDGTPENVLLVDFQLCFYGSPTIDLILGLYLIASDEVRDNHRDEVIYHYASVFQETLKKLNFTGRIPTVGDFHEELYKDRVYELFVFATFYPTLPAFLHPDKYNFALAIENSEYRKQLFLKPEFVERVTNRLPQLLYKGYLD